jgi:hypothetical protein
VPAAVAGHARAVEEEVAVVVAAAVVAAADGVVDGEHEMNRNRYSLLRAVRGMRLAVLAGMVLLASPVWAQKAFATPDAAMNAFIDSLARNDEAETKVVLGPDWKKYIPVTANGGDVTNFLEATAKGHKIVAAGSDKAWIEAGTHGWTLPIPIVKTAAGWSFDIKEAPEELRTRRIGRNELTVIQVILAITDAQEDYAQHDRDRDGVKQYAQKFLSTPGKHDGLYWPALPGEALSPLGPIGADAKPGEAYHGYRYRILTAQGKDAPGGAKSYVINGHMTGGYAVIAWPAQWGDTGVMTFVVAKDGVVYQKDLGAKTDTTATAIKAFDPDATWHKLPPAP